MADARHKLGSNIHLMAAAHDPQSCARTRALGSRFARNYNPHFQAQSLLLCVILIEDATEEMGPAKQDRGNILLFVPNLIG